MVVSWGTRSAWLAVCIVFFQGLEKGETMFTLFTKSADRASVIIQYNFLTRWWTLGRLRAVDGLSRWPVLFARFGAVVMLQDTSFGGSVVV